jgi:predicted CXXCH cytochrome family protein
VPGGPRRPPRPSLGRIDGPRLTFTTAPASAWFPLRPAFGPVAIPRWGEGHYRVTLEVSDGAHRSLTRAEVRSAGTTGGWPRAETGLDLTVSCGEHEDTQARWVLSEKPPTSAAGVLEADRCLARVRADRNGHYVLRETRSGSTLPFWYGDWVGHEQCGRPECHPSEHETWRQTRHATVFERGIDGLLGEQYGPSCIGCHVLGSDPASASAGFARAAASARWSMPAHPAAGNSAALPASVRLWANVQCEQCHGPGRFWTGLSADVCAQCHDAPPRYGVVAEWRRSPMSVSPAGVAAARGDCASCHTAHGAIGRLRGRSMPRPHEEPVAQGVTCAVCHDPHVARGPAQLRRAGDVTFAGKTIAAGQGAVCFTCHGIWGAGRDPDPLLGDVPHAPQAFMLLTAAPRGHAPHANVRDLCVGCHMFGAGRRAQGPREMGGHTFSLRSGRDTLDAACRPCHQDVAHLRVHGGEGQQELAVETARLEAEVKLAVAALGLTACDGSRAVDVAARDGRIVLLDALGRVVAGCGGDPLAVPGSAERLWSALRGLLIVKGDGSEGVHNLPLARALIEQGRLALARR